MRAQSLNLVGAELSVRIETDGKVTVFAGANTRPIAVAHACRPRRCRRRPADRRRAARLLKTSPRVLAWIDGLGATGLDGHDLRELGLKNGNLTVDDQRNGKRWTFSDINVSLSRPELGRRDLPHRVRQRGAALADQRRAASAWGRRARGRHRGAAGLAQ